METSSTQNSSSLRCDDSLASDECGDLRHIDLAVVAAVDVRLAHRLASRTLCYTTSAGCEAPCAMLVQEGGTSRRVDWAGVDVKEIA